MSNAPYDPLAAWQKFVQDWELEINAWSGKFTESEQFSAIMGQATKMMLVAQRTVTDQLENVLQSLNLPTKAQVEGLSDRLDAIEDSIAQLRIALDKLAQDGPVPAGKPEPSRTRKPAGKAD
ncbi:MULTISPECIES: hypothetical protein [Novosphingobium]|uniref:Poly(3-hydroxyalkanoate) polymerase subunit PhaE n=1 Tax=Novosphingobium mathurense TaxID=428990 RepID=A0A1U6GRP9_9SPHN|nr:MULTISPECIES: hypothetical protein [Novosphingobium]CDO35318.1 conserved hypothetical protein [Novosphingobium sp. KN65.2]SLJ86100.1 hypothetical protein SAMN06295987_10175 [Novosphingobium mathurense]